MSPSKFLNDSEFKAVLDKVNQVICEFSKSADKTQEAVLFLTKISEKCSSRDEFLKLVEQRLDLLSNPNKSKEHIEWFVTRRRSLVTLLQNIKDKVVRDPTYISKFSPSFGKGIQSLDHLLKLDEKAIGHGHIAELTRVKKLVMEIKAEADTKAKALESAHLVKADAFFLYDKLLDVISTMNVLVLEGGNEVTNHQPTAGSDWCAGCVRSSI